MKLKYLQICCAGLMFILMMGSVSFGQPEEKKYTSLWEGFIKTNALSLRLAVKIYKNDDGSLGAFLDSPDQGAKNIPIDKVSLTDDSLNFTINSAMAKYNGVIIKDSAIVKGKWVQGGKTSPLDLKKVGALTKVNRPQTPVPPFPYNSEDVTFENNTAKIALAGTLTYPKSGGKFPAVVLVTGSGPQDRDEAIFEHKPFLVIADYLSKNGIAVLRCDDRGVGKSTGRFASATTADFASDALAAVEYLKTRKEIDAKKIGVMGHSEGGAIAPMVANNSNDVAYIILLAGPGVRGDELLIKQTELIMDSKNSKKEEIEKSVGINRKIYSIIVNEPDSTAAVKKLQQLYEDEIKKLDEKEKKKEEYSLESFNSAIRTVMTPWFRFFLKYDPRPVLENITIPVLALNGEKDIQVSPKENLGGIETALKNAGNKNYKIVELPGLNHLFQHCVKCDLSEYGQIEETFSEEALKIIKDWILEITR